MKLSVTTITKCRVCLNTGFSEVLDLGHQCLSGCFPRANEIDPPRAPLALIRCEHCGFVQLRETVDPASLFTSGYGYRSGVNQTMRGHLAAIASKNVTLIDKIDATVLDIGCNDGTLLSQYPNQFAKFGIDPLADKFRSFYPEDMVSTATFFSASAFSALSGRKKADVITSIAMFYDIDDPNGFVADIASSLENDGIWVLEQSYMPTMLEMNSYDTICHEHLGYYSLHQIETLLEHHGLRVFDVELNAINGGSFRVYACSQSSDRVETPQVELRRREELEANLSSGKTYDRFRERCFKMRDELRAFVERERAGSRRIHVYGASTKGNTILQFCGLDSHFIEAAADRNGEKAGARTPGTNIPIISEEDSRAMRPDYYLALPWHFKDEFLRRESEFRARGGKFVFPLPELQVV